MKLKFTKMHGAGNDFIVVDARDQPKVLKLSPQHFRQLADRRYGIGADQILIVAEPSHPQAQFEYRIFNADGQEVEQCGNGARCFTRFVIDHQLAVGPQICLQTKAGLISPRLLASGQIEVNMGLASLTADSLPFDTVGLPERKIAEHVCYELEIPDLAPFWVSPVSMGNPHLVQWVTDLEESPVERIGAWLQASARLPMRVNAGFAQVLSRHEIGLRVYERGAGETLACGTGACAAVVAGIAQQRLAANAPIKIQARGGLLTVQWSGQAHEAVYLSGEATTVYEGVIDL